MKQNIFIAIFSLALCVACYAQNDTKALGLLNKASAAYNKAGGINAGFTLRELGTGGHATNNINGTIHMKGSRFKLVVDEMTTWFDGKNQWVYIVQSKEVNVSNPTEEELLMINPVKVFQLYKHGYKCKWAGEKNEGGRTVQKVMLTPINKFSSLQSIIASFDKTTLRPVSIVITNKDKSGSRISISTYVTGQTYSDTHFIFQQKNYPNTEVIDLR